MSSVKILVVIWFPAGAIRTTLDSNMPEIQLVREWDADSFHKKVLELEQQGYVSKMDTYKITAEMNPETGVIVHLHSIEMHKSE